MAVSRGQRLRKSAAKAVKRKAAVAQKLAAQRKERAISKPRHVDLAVSPLGDCLLRDDPATQGRALLVVTRKLALGRLAVAEYDIDFWCLGVVSAHFQVDEAEDYQPFRERLEDEDAQSIAPERARLLLRDAAAFGQKNGFPPPPNFAEIERMLEDFEPAGEPFAFGDEGRPHYVIRPGDPDWAVREVVDTLTQALGPDGFDLTYPVEEDAPEGEGAP